MVSRREFLEILGGGIAGLVIGGALGYTLAPKGPAPGKEKAGKLPGVPSEPLKIGGMWFISGKFGTYGDMAKKALNMAIDEINATGGILGRKVEVTLKDEADRENVLKNIRKMVEEEGAEFLIGIDSSGDVLKLTPVVEKELHVVTLITHAATPKLTACNNLHYVFRISMYEEPIDIAAARLVAEKFKDVKKVASIGPDYAYGYDSWAIFSSALKELMPGVEWMEPMYSKLGTEDFSTYIDKMLSYGPDLVFSSLWGGDAATFVKQANSKGLFDSIKYYLNPMLGATDTLKAIGDGNVPSKAEVWGSGRYWFLYPPHDVYPLNKSFVNKFKSKYGEYPPYVSATSYTAIYALKAAIEKAYVMKGAWPSQDDVVTALEGLAVAGPMGPVAIRKEDHQGVYSVFWGKLAKGAPNYPHPILTDLKIFDFGEVFPAPKKSYVKCS